MKYLLAFLLGAVCFAGYNFAYWLGGIDKQNEIVYNCRDYGKHVLEADGLWQINCVGPFNPWLTLPEYKPYDPALVKRDAKKRK
jgi:hypothetical protein